MSDPDILNAWHKQRRGDQFWRNTTGTIGFHYDLQ